MITEKKIAKQITYWPVSAGRFVGRAGDSADRQTIQNKRNISNLIKLEIGLKLNIFMFYVFLRTLYNKGTTVRGSYSERIIQ